MGAELQQLQLRRRPAEASGLDEHFWLNKMSRRMFLSVCCVMVTVGLEGTGHTVLVTALNRNHGSDARGNVREGGVECASSVLV